MTRSLGYQIQRCPVYGCGASRGRSIVLLRKRYIKGGRGRKSAKERIRTNAWAHLKRPREGCPFHIHAFKTVLDTVPPEIWEEVKAAEKETVVQTADVQAALQLQAERGDIRRARPGPDADDRSGDGTEEEPDRAKDVDDYGADSDPDSGGLGTKESRDHERRDERQEERNRLPHERLRRGGC